MQQWSEIETEIETEIGYDWVDCRERGRDTVKIWIDKKTNQMGFSLII